MKIKTLIFMDKRNLQWLQWWQINICETVLRNLGDYTNMVSHICAKQSFHICRCMLVSHVYLQTDQQLQSIRNGDRLLTLSHLWFWNLKYIYLSTIQHAICSDSESFVKLWKINNLLDASVLIVATCLLCQIMFGQCWHL
jgi:hypothetical protein